MPRITPFLLAATLLLAAGPAAAAVVLATGTFDGRSGHAVSGTVTVVAAGSGHRLVLQSDFRLDGAPDPWLGFGDDGYVADSRFAELEHNTGKQSYALPADFDPGAYNEVWLWCEAFSVPLGVARLEHMQ